jgi:3',5'-cyclic AMP phosphodiesterase CpdA
MKRTFVSCFLALACIILPGYAQDTPFRFVILTDIQFGMFSGDKEFAQETANLEFAVAAVNRLKPGFVIVLGDLVNKTGDPAEILEYLRVAGKIDPAVPVYNIAGNHDVGNEPTPESLGAFRKNIGRDYYSFRAGPVYGIVLDSTLMHSPQNALSEYDAQDRWLRRELETAKASGAPHILVFQHHPVFINDAQEPDGYENIPLARRKALLDLYRQYGVKYVFSGHTHRNVLTRDGDLEIVATGPTGKPLAKDGSGLRIVTITGNKLEHRYFDFGFLP